jgi:hypothetical protein
MSILTNLNDDIELFKRHPDAYMEIYNAISQLDEESFDEYMGEEYKEEPKLTKEDLELKIKNYRDRYINAQNNSMPEAIVQFELDKLTVYMDKLKNGDYIQTLDDEEYKKNYEEKKDSYWEWKNQILR